MEGLLSTWHTPSSLDASIISYKANLGNSVSKLNFLLPYVDDNGKITLINGKLSIDIA